MPTERVLQRIRAVQRAMVRGRATRVVEIPGGFVALNEVVPVSYEHNLAVLSEPLPDPAAALDAVEQTMGAAGLPHRRVVLQTAAPPPAYLGRLGEGWKRERDLLMAQTGNPDRPAAGRAVELTWPEVRGSYVESWRQTFPDDDPDVWRQLADRRDETARACTVRHFGVVVDGGIAARAELRLRAGAGQVEDVETLEEHRGRGYAREVVLAAAAAARAAAADLVWLLADTDDWPRELYARLGFVEVGGNTAFSLDVRQPAE